MRLLAFCVWMGCFTLAIQAGPVKSIKIRGYVTAVQSQSVFEIDDYRIQRDQTLTLDFGKEDEDEDDGPELPKEIRVGTEMEIKGEYNSETHTLKAKSVKVFPADTGRLKRTALLEHVPQLTKKASYWEGTIRLDGQTLLVDERTRVSIVPNQTQKKAQKAIAKAAKKATPTDSATDESVALKKLDDVHQNMFVAYEGRRQDDGQVRATKLEFKDNELTSSEAKLWTSLKPKVKALRDTRPGELQVGKIGKFKTTPDEAAQKYIRELGESLIPACQRSLPLSDPGKIPFQFHLVESKVPNAFATANGVIVVFAPMIRSVDNEAQLAFILSHEIAHATQEHTLRQMEFHKKKRLLLSIAAAAAAGYGAYNLSDLLNLASAAIVNGYSRYLENQADRVGMEYMMAAGFDPREAPNAWKAMSLKSGDAPTDFFWSSHDNNTTRRSYLMSELRSNYPRTDFGAFRKDSDRFKTISGVLESRNQKGKKVKVKS